MRVRYEDALSANHRVIPVLHKFLGLDHGANGDHANPGLDVSSDPVPPERAAANAIAQVLAINQYGRCPPS